MKHFKEVLAQQVELLKKRIQEKIYFHNSGSESPVTPIEMIDMLSLFNELKRKEPLPERYLKLGVREGVFVSEEKYWKILAFLGLSGEAVSEAAAA